MNLNDPVTVPKDPATILGDEEAEDAGKQTNSTKESTEAQKSTSAAQPNAEQDSVADGGFDQQRTETEETRSPQRSALINEPHATLSNSDQQDMEIKRNEVESDATSRYTNDSTQRPFAYSSADEILAKYLGKSSVLDTAANYPIFSSRYSSLLGATTAPSYVDAKFPVAVTTSTYAHPITVSESAALLSTANRDSKVHTEADALGKQVDVEKELPGSSKSSPSLRLHTKMNIETTKLLARLNEVSMRPTLTGLCDARVADWLRSLELANVERYIRLFAEHEVDFRSLQLLSVSDLREMGINAIGPLNKIAYAIRELRRVAPVASKPVSL